MQIHPRIFDAIISLLKQDVAEFYSKRPAIELRNPHLELRDYESCASAAGERRFQRAQQARG